MPSSLLTNFGSLSHWRKMEKLSAPVDVGSNKTFTNFYEPARSSKYVKQFQPIRGQDCGSVPVKGRGQTAL